jgi:drug/metabolite transporter (DMT)-like permease
MKHLEVNRVTMLLAIVPLTTVAAMAVSGPLMPGLLKAEQLNGTSILGAILVVVGSMLGNIRKKYKSK